MINIELSEAIWILEELTDLKENGPQLTCTDLGICFHCESFRELSVLTRREIYFNWPYYSGNPSYPVPDPESVLSSEEIFDNTEDLWVGEYGRLRYDLLDYLIKYFTKLVLELEK